MATLSRDNLSLRICCTSTCTLDRVVNSYDFVSLFGWTANIMLWLFTKKENGKNHVTWNAIRTLNFEDDNNVHNRDVLLLSKWKRQNHCHNVSILWQELRFGHSNKGHHHFHDVLEWMPNWKMMWFDSLSFPMNGLYLNICCTFLSHWML